MVTQKHCQIRIALLFCQVRKNKSRGVIAAPAFAINQPSGIIDLFERLQFSEPSDCVAFVISVPKTRAAFLFGHLALLEKWGNPFP
jgi:hypothetical protein